MGTSHTRRHMLELEANLERAGYSLACPFTSSSEFEAAVIRAKRQAGALRATPSSPACGLCRQHRFRNGSCHLERNVRQLLALTDDEMRRWLPLLRAARGDAMVAL